MEYRNNHYATAFNKAAKKLRISADGLATMFDALPMGVAIADADAEVVVCNKQMRRFLPTGILPFKDDERYWRWRTNQPDAGLLERCDFPGARALRGETVFPGVEMLYTQDDGNEVLTRYAAIPIKDGDGKTLSQVVVMITEISALKPAAVSLRKRDHVEAVRSAKNAGEPSLKSSEAMAILPTEEHFLETLTGIAPLLIYTYHLQERRFIYLNIPLRNLIGREKEYIDAMGPHLLQAILHPDDVQSHIAYLEGLDTLQEGEVRTREFRIWKNGAFRWFRSRNSIFIHEDGTVNQVIGIYEDIMFEKRILGERDFQTGPLN
jgi:PAS domain S-box-containing protein